MTLHIQNPEADRLAHELASRTGMSVEDAVLDALKERMSSAQAPAKQPPFRRKALYDAIMEISEHCATLPDYDTRSPEEMLYDENGLPY